MLSILSFSKQVPIWYWHLKNTDIDISSKSMKNSKICFWLLVWFHNKHARSTLHHISTRSLRETNLWCSKVFSVIHYDPPCYNSKNCQVLIYSSDLPQVLHYSPSTKRFLEVFWSNVHQCNVKDSLIQHIIITGRRWGKVTYKLTVRQTVRQIVRQPDRQGVSNVGLAQCEIQHMLFYAHYTLVGSDRATEEEGVSYAMKDSRLKCMLEKLECKIQDKCS